MRVRFSQYVAVFFFCCLMTGCGSIPRTTFEPTDQPGPDYSKDKNWAALPFRKDSADAVPVAEWVDVQDDADVDIFFLHPTTYIGKRGQKKWNADINDAKVNQQTDQSTIRYQASIFNNVGKIYAPRYRQAHLHCFYTEKEKKDAALALDLAYSDVRKAFSYYIEHFNQGRPFIIAAHSQGSFHAARLIRDEIENTHLQTQLVVAYLPGMPVPADYFSTTLPCKKKEDTGCFCSWRTFQTGYLPPKQHFPEKNIVVTNPVTWTSDDKVSTMEQHEGAILRNFYQMMPDLLTAQVHQDLLWVSKPKFPWSFLLTTKNYHIADYNFFYADVRRNALLRVRTFMGRR